MKRGWIWAALAAVLLAGSALGESGELGVDVSSPEIRPGYPVVVYITAPEDGVCDLLLETPEGELLMAAVKGREVQAGYNALYWNGTAGGTDAPFGQARLVAEMNGERAETAVEIVAGPPEPTPPLTPVPTAEPLTDELWEKGLNGFTPSHGSPWEGEDLTLNYWTMPMDITDEETVWKVLVSPVTVVDNGSKTAEKEQVVIRSEPSAESEGIGVVTCVSQGVHVLERGEEWTQIECYSSSFNDSKVLNWNALVQGWVPTAWLREVIPNQEMGLVVDKLTQRLYVFVEGKLFSTLLVSTGKVNKKQPYNETRSGDFLLVSKVGEFYSGNLRCGWAIRFNDGDLLHEVPCVLYDGGKFKDYSTTEPKLGERASHGCIRVARKSTPEGVNQGWIWNHYQKNTRILIWEDWQGRQIPLPDEDTPLYADNNKKNGYYHLSDECARVTKKFTALTYAELENQKYRKLKPCPDCVAPAREKTIRNINATYAEGGDHNPLLTKALESCPRTQKGK